MLGDGVNTMTYDAENRVVTSSNGSSSAAYVYDGNGLRVKKCIPNCSSATTITRYIFSGCQVIAEYDNGAAVNAPTREYLYAGGTKIATVDTAMKFHLRDHLSVRVNTDSSGNIIGEQGHYPFGDSWYLNNTTTKEQFTTYERDAESGNDYAMARYNVNRLGRFSSVDPLPGSLGNPQSLNHYAYALNDPINGADPIGLDPTFPDQPQTPCSGQNPPPVCIQEIPTDGGGNGCTLDGITTSCGSINQQDSFACGNACQISTTTSVFLNGIIIATYTQVWDLSAFANEARYYAEAGPGAMFSTIDDAGSAAGMYFAPFTTSLNREFFGKVLAPDSEGFYSYDLEDVGPVCSAGSCHSGPGFATVDGAAVWHDHPPPNNYLSTTLDRTLPHAAIDYVTEDMGGSNTTFRISPWNGGVNGQYPSLSLGPGALNNGSIAFMCQLSAGVGFPNTPMCH
jgi:RHS repeat-associated protein